MPLSRKSSRSWGHTGTPSLGTDLSASSVLTTVLTYTKKTKAVLANLREAFCPCSPWGEEKGKTEQVLHRGC